MTASREKAALAVFFIFMVWGFIEVGGLVQVGGLN